VTTGKDLVEIHKTIKKLAKKKIIINPLKLTALNKISGLKWYSLLIMLYQPNG